MATTHYYLHQERIAHSVTNFFHDRSDLTYSIVESKKEYDVYICSSAVVDPKKDKGKSILRILFSSSKTSFQIQGKETFKEVCNQCRDKIIEECRIQNVQTANRHFTYNKVSSKSFNEILEWFRQNESVTVTNHPGDHVIVSRHTICGFFDSHVSLTYYHNDTLLIQGLISSLLIKVVQEVNILLNVDECKDDSAFLKVLDALPHEILSSDLHTHFVNLQELSNTPYENMILSSIHLINSNIELGDYTCMAFGALRALEGILGHRMNLTQPITGSHDKLGKYFTPDATGEYKFNPRFPHYNGKPDLKRACEKGYTHYNLHRNPHFHCDIPNPMDTFIILTKEHAIDAVEETIKRIDAILTHWND